MNFTISQLSLVAAILQGDNAGLQSIFGKLEKICSDLNLAAEGVSIADFWALARLVTVELGITLHRGQKLLVYKVFDICHFGS